MNFYRQLDVDSSPVRIEGYAETLATAHINAKLYTKSHLCDLRIELIDVPTDKAAVCALLNGDIPELPALRTWKLTARGGLTEVENGE
jgi:hypothetical protein